MKKERKAKPLTNESGEVRELAKGDFKRAVPFSALPASLQSKLKVIQKTGRPRSLAPKQMIAFRFAPDLLAAIKASGRGYNARVERVLRHALEEGRI